MLTWTLAGYRLMVDPDRLDLLMFDRAVHAAREARASGDLAGAAQAWHAGLRLWRGSVCEGLDSPLLDAERDRLAERWVTAVENRVEVDLAVGRHFELIAELQQLVLEHPLRERLRGQLMLALYRCGRRPEASAVFAEAGRFLRDQLGVDPGRQLQDLHPKILAGDPSVHSPAAVEGEPAPRVSGEPPGAAVWNVPARNPRHLDSERRPPGEPRLVGVYSSEVQAKFVADMELGVPVVDGIASAQPLSDQATPCVPT